MGSNSQVEEPQQQILNTPNTNSMPFELRDSDINRDSFKSKFTDSNKIRQSNVMTYVHNVEKRSLSQVGQKIRQSSSVEEQQDTQTQMRSMQKNDFTMS